MVQYTGLLLQPCSHTHHRRPNTSFFILVCIWPFPGHILLCLRLPSSQMVLEQRSSWLPTALAASVLTLPSKHTYIQLLNCIQTHYYPHNTTYTAAMLRMVHQCTTVYPYSHNSKSTHHQQQRNRQQKDPTKYKEQIRTDQNRQNRHQHTAHSTYWDR